MTFVTPFDLVIAAGLALRRFGLARTMLVALMLLPVYTWSLPPIGCGCFRPLFRRCAYGRAYMAAVKSDLKNLASQQEIYFSDHGVYSHDPDELAFTHSDGVTVTILASPEGWAAVATHAAVENGRGCAIYYGTDVTFEAGLLVGGQPGEVVCQT